MSSETEPSSTEPTSVDSSIGSTSTVISGADFQYKPGQSKKIDPIPVTLYETEALYQPGKLVTTDKKFLAYGMKSGGIRVIDKLTAKRALLKAHTGGWLTDLAFEPGNKHVLASAGRDNQLAVSEVSYDEADAAVVVNTLFRIKRSSAETFIRLRWNPANRNVLFTFSTVGKTECQADVWYIDELKAAAAGRENLTLDSDSIPASGHTLIRTFTSTPSTSSSGSDTDAIPGDLAVSADGKRLVIRGSSPHEVEVWEATAVEVKARKDSPTEGAGEATEGGGDDLSGTGGGDVKEAVATTTTYQCIFQWTHDEIHPLTSVLYLGSNIHPQLGHFVVTGSAKNQHLKLWALPQQSPPSGEVRLVQTLTFVPHEEKYTFQNVVDVDPTSRLLVVCNQCDPRAWTIHVQEPTRASGGDGEAPEEYKTSLDYITEFDLGQTVVSFTANFQKPGRSSSSSFSSTTSEPLTPSSATPTPATPATPATIGPMGIVCVQDHAIQLFYFSPPWTYPPSVAAAHQVPAKKSRAEPKQRSGSESQLQSKPASRISGGANVYAQFTDALNASVASAPGSLEPPVSEPQRDNVGPSSVENGTAQENASPQDTDDDTSGAAHSRSGVSEGYYAPGYQHHAHADAPEAQPSHSIMQMLQQQTQNHRSQPAEMYDPAVISASSSSADPSLSSGAATGPRALSPGRLHASAVAHHMAASTEGSAAAPASLTGPVTGEMGLDRQLLALQNRLFAEMATQRAVDRAEYTRKLAELASAVKASTEDQEKKRIEERNTIISQTRMLFQTQNDQIKRATTEALHSQSELNRPAFGALAGQIEQLLKSHHQEQLRLTDEMRRQTEHLKSQIAKQDENAQRFWKQAAQQQSDEQKRVAAMIDTIGSTVATSLPNLITDVVKKELQQLPTKLEKIIETSIKENVKVQFAQSVLPRFEALSQKIFAQLESSLKQSLEQSSEQVVKHLSVEVIGNIITHRVSETFRHTMDLVPDQIGRVLADQLRETVPAIVQQTVPMMVDAAIRQQQQQMSARGGFGGAAHHYNPEEEERRFKAHLMSLVEAKNYLQVFTEVLNANSLTLVEYVIKNCNCEDVFSPEGPALPTHIILALIQQLAYDLSRETPMKLSWLNEAMGALEIPNAKDPAVNKIFAEVAVNVDNLADTGDSVHRKQARTLSRLVRGMMAHP